MKIHTLFYNRVLKWQECTSAGKIKQQFHVLLVKELFVTGEFCLVFFSYLLPNFHILTELMHSRHFIA